MDARELRIGNWVSSEFDGETTVSVKLLERIIYEMENVCAIPLTEEWFRKFGFEERGYKWYYKSWFSEYSQDGTNEIVISLLSGRCNVSTAEAKEEGSYTAKEVSHVHQLQNLYFALTGEELTLAA